LKTFYDKEDYTTDDIQSLIDNEVEESIYLDFKEAGALDKSDHKKKEISKDVSSFANSDGGIIVYGVREESHKANSFSFINGNDYTKEWLEQVISSSIQRHIPDLKIYPLRMDGQNEKTVYLVKIPKSIEAPHLSKDKRFYKRFNFESVMMEEYEIRQLYGRKVKSKLLLAGFSIRRFDPQDNHKANLIFEVQALNHGDISESEYKVNVYFNNLDKMLDFSWGAHQTNYDYTIMEDRKIKISAVGQTPIFPEEKVNVMRFNFSVPLINLIDILSKVTVEIILFYPNGDDKISGDFKELTDNIIKQDTKLKLS